MYIIDLLFENGNITREGLLNVAAFIFALLLALVLHEVAHGLVAYWNGDDTAKIYGRLTLNPLKHFDIFGFLMLLVIGFGWAKPVPVNPDKFKRKTAGMIGVSLAGVITNFLLALIFALFYTLLRGTVGGVRFCAENYYFGHFLASLFSLTISLNISFGLFNLLPLYPLDGYRFLSCFVSQENGFMRFLRKYSLYIILGCLVLNYIPFVSAYSPFTLYISKLGGYIRNGFLGFWGLFF